MWYSHLGYVAQLLKAKEICPKEVECQPPRDLQTVSDDFLKALEGNENDEVKGTSGMFNESLGALKEAIGNDYESREAFSEHLFQALRQCVKQYERETANPDFIIISSTKSTTADDDGAGEYAVGFTRNMHPSLDLFKMYRGDLVCASDSSNDSENMLDPSQHLVCLFRRNHKIKADNGQEWEPIDCFSFVELRTGDRTCGMFKRGKDKSIQLSRDLEDAHELFGEVVCCSVERVVQYHARRGKRDGEMPLLPLAILAAVKRDTIVKTETIPESKKHKTPERVRWVSGQLHAPMACGNSFYYSVKDFGHFNDELSVENSLSLYLDTMLFGLKVAVQVCDEFVNGNLSPPLPASGSNLMVGNKRLTPTLCASPIKGANPIPGVTGRSINQGELFHGKLKLDKIFDAAKRDLVFRAPQVDTTQELDVLIKVSSTAVHSLLVSPRSAASALRSIEELDILCEALGTVLYAAVNMRSGLMTIMADLPRARFKTLHPHAFNLEILWGGFSRLVKEVLLPLASGPGIIHADIRPGYDLTSNILVDESAGGASLKLIDYESLLLSERFVPPGNYLPYDDDANTFVWWQCVAVAYFWSEKLDLDSRTKSNPDMFELERMRHMLLHNVAGPDWLMKLRDQAKRNIRESEVKETLNVLAVLFKNGDK
jgi:hypothetical protein